MKIFDILKGAFSTKTVINTSAGQVKLSNEDEQKAKEIAEKVKTVIQYRKLEERIDKKMEQAHDAETERTQEKYEHEGDVLDRALKYANDYIVGYRINDEGQIYKTEEDAKKHIKDEDEDYIEEACLGDLANE
ncbi:hypothetical protein LCGC14_2965550 [marine sediment metagenome]|uniref:Uncharacterized protein n=1 Tax=marine sediment metagenome TaxID=412755 RepID=A0A0F9A284_9ZZZZ